MIQTSTLQAFENKSNFVIRQGASTVTALIHLSLFWGSDNLLLWIFATCHLLFYASVLYYLPPLRRNSSYNLLIDSTLYSFCLGIWGYNLFLASAYIASNSIVNAAAGGLPALRRSLVFLGIGALAGGLIADFYYRPYLPISTQLITATGLTLFMAVLGMKIYKINRRLRAIRNSLRDQREELLHLNTLALAVNANLDVDVIMQSVMQTIEQLYPFEALYILSFDETAQRLEVLGIYGSSITEEEHAAFRSLRFDTARDHNSIFVKTLIKRRAVYLPHIDEHMVSQGDKIDYELYRVKPSVSLAYFPIFVKDKVVAGAAFINYERPFQLSQRDIERIQQFLVQVGTTVRNATLFKELALAKENAEIARKKAQSSEETKSRFLANMSHEIRTPLTAIMGYSDALTEEGITNEERTSFISHILRNGKHLLSMINDILDISKIEARKIEVELLRCNLLEILSDIDSYIKIKTREKNLAYDLSIAFPIPLHLVTDPTRLKQILLNLCNNAVKFTAQGNITINVRMAAEHQLQISVSDTGIGIDENEKNRVFNAFDQADTSTTRLFGGTGLGLYISKNLALLLGGDLTFNSKKGAGATFTLSLPLSTGTSDFVRSQDDFQKLTDKLLEAQSYSRIIKISGKALVAEDNQENQCLIERLLKQAGMEVDVVDNGFKAVEAATQKEYTLILMDMQMPTMSGHQAALLIRERGITTPIVAFTANVMKHQIDEYENLGFAGVVEKPIAREKLFATLRRIAKEKPPTSTCRVLIADDNEVNQMILFRYVTKANENAQISLAANGEMAVDLVNQHKFDLILMDMEMPIMGGLLATEKIRALGHDMPIYIVSGNVSFEDRDRCFSAGATGHIGKPLDKGQMLNLLRNHLN